MMYKLGFTAEKTQGSPCLTFGFRSLKPVLCFTSSLKLYLVSTNRKSSLLLQQLQLLMSCGKSLCYYFESTLL